MATQRPDAVAGTKYDSKGRWISLSVLLVCVFLLAVVGGYILQRSGSESAVQSDLAAVEPLSGGSENGNPADTTQSRAGNGGAGQAGAGIGNPAGNPSADTAQEPAASSAASAGSGRKTAAASPAAAPKRVAEPAPPPATQAPHEGATTPPPANPVPAAPPASASPPASSPPAHTPPQTPSRPAPSAPSATIVAEGETFGGATPVRRAAPNTRVLKPDGQSPPASQPVTPSVQPPAAPPAAIEEGILYWTGRLRKNQVIVIENSRASVGQIDGKLPGIPVDVWLPSPAVVLAERPNAGNNWSRVAFRCVRDTDRNVTINVQWKRLR